MKIEFYDVWNCCKSYYNMKIQNATYMYKNVLITPNNNTHANRKINFMNTKKHDVKKWVVNRLKWRRLTGQQNTVGLELTDEFNKINVHIIVTKAEKFPVKWSKKLG